MLQFPLTLKSNSYYLPNVYNFQSRPGMEGSLPQPVQDPLVESNHTSEQLNVQYVRSTDTELWTQAKPNWMLMVKSYRSIITTANHPPSQHHITAVREYSLKHTRMAQKLSCSCVPSQAAVWWSSCQDLTPKCELGIRVFKRVENFSQDFFP